MTFQALVKSNPPAKEVFLFVQPDGQDTWVEKVEVTAQGEIAHQVDLVSHPIPPFSAVDYWYRVVATDGKEYKSAPQRFEYQDNRFKWQSAEDKNFKAYWYDGDLAFGQTILNTAESSLESTQNLLSAQPPRPLHIYVYSQASDLQSALQLTNQDWVAGHAAPKLGLMMISIPPGPEQRLELERQLPHEIMHILQYQVAGENFDKLPAWLTEGLASLAELYPNPDYQRALLRSAQNGALLPMTRLCSPFPREASVAFLSYAQSASLVRYVHQKYGKSGLRSLINRYQDGLGCEEGTEAALGITLSQLEVQWQQEFLGLNTTTLILRNLTPYLLLALFVLIPLPIVLFSLPRRKSRYPLEKGL